MPFLRGFLTLTLFLLLGESLKFVLGWPISGGVGGMLLVTAWLMFNGRLSGDLASASQGLISILIVLIMPGVVGVFFLGERFLGQWLNIGAALVLGTAMSVLTTLLLMKAFGGLKGDKNG